MAPGEPVRDRAAFLAAINRGTASVSVAGRIEGLPPTILHREQHIVGTGEGAALVFERGGLRLTADNVLTDLQILSVPDQMAIGIDAKASACGSFTLHNIGCTGSVQFLVDDAAGSVDLAIDGLTIHSADAAAHMPREYGNGVEVQQGALTIWNRASRPTIMTLRAHRINIGRPAAPVIGAGVFIGGRSVGGSVVIKAIDIGAVYSDSGLPEGTLACVSAGVFISYGVHSRQILCGPVMTWGANAVPIDNWGNTDLWQITGDVVSHGPSAVGFVNAGQLGTLRIDGILQTFGDGARGCCIYGPTGTIAARAIRTHGNAAAAVQVVATLERLEIAEEIMTRGDSGEGLMKGQMVLTPADGVHVEPGGRLGHLDVPVIRVSSRDALPVREEGVIESAQPYRTTN